MVESIKIKEPQNKLKLFLIAVADIIAFVVFILGLFIFVKTFVAAIVIVKGHSMLPNYNERDIILVDEIYWKYFWWINRWDVVVVMPPTTNVSYLKRVVGLPGDTIEIKSGFVYLCRTKDYWEAYTWNDVDLKNTYTDWSLICKKLKEDYIAWKTVNYKWYPEKIVTTAPCGIDKFKLYSWQYLVFWDDRMYSTDSRCCFRWACIWKNDIYYITKDEILWKVIDFKKLLGK